MEKKLEILKPLKEKNFNINENVSKSKLLLIGDSARVTTSFTMCEIFFRESLLYI
jgi:hypothetical protein